MKLTKADVIAALDETNKEVHRSFQIHDATGSYFHQLVESLDFTTKMMHHIPESHFFWQGLLHRLNEKISAQSSAENQPNQQPR